MIGCRQNCGDATALFEQIDLRTRHQINPATDRIAPKPRDWDQFSMAPTGKECPSLGIELNTWKAKVERFVPARLIAVCIRQITERNPRRQFAMGSLEVELVLNHFAVRECLRMIGAGNADRARHCRTAHREKSRQENRDSHPTNLGRDTRSSSVCLDHLLQYLF